MENNQKPTLKRTVFITLSIILVLSLFLTGCGSNNEAQNNQTNNSKATDTPKATDKPKEPVTIDFWYEGSGPSRTELYEGIIKEWNENNPDIIVKGTYIALDSAMEKLNVSIAGGVTPDIVTIQPSWAGQLFGQDLFVNLDEKFNAWDQSKQFSSDFLNVIRGADTEGRLLALPQAANMYGIWYRQNIFKEKGLESPGESWDTFFTDIEKLTDKSTHTYGHTIRGGKTSVTQLLYILIAYVGLPDFFDADGKAQILRSPEATDFINRYADVFKKGQAPQSSLTASFKEMAADFTSGVSMSYIHNLGSFETVGTAFEPDQYGLAMFPKSPSTGKYTTVQPTVKSNALFKTSEHQDEAWEFMKFLASTESDSAINSLIGELPVRQDTMEAEWVKSAPHLKEVVPFLVDKEKLAVRYPNYLVEFDSIMNQVGEPSFQAVLTGKMTAEEFLDELAIKFEASKANQK